MWTVTGNNVLTFSHPQREERVVVQVCKNWFTVGNRGAGHVADDAAITYRGWDMHWTCLPTTSTPQRILMKRGYSFPLVCEAYRREGENSPLPQLILNQYLCDDMNDGRTYNPEEAGMIVGGAILPGDLVDYFCRTMQPLGLQLPPPSIPQPQRTQPLASTLLDPR